MDSERHPRTHTAARKLSARARQLARTLVEGFDAADATRASTLAILDEWTGDSASTNRLTCRAARPSSPLPLGVCCSLLRTPPAGSTQAELVRAALASLQSIFGISAKIRTLLESVYLHDWQADPFARAARQILAA